MSSLVEIILKILYPQGTLDGISGHVTLLHEEYFWGVTREMEYRNKLVDEYSIFHHRKR